MKYLITAAIAGLLAGPVLADGHETGDADKGKKAFNKCKSCHMIEDGEGNKIVKGGRTGPNLYGVIGRTIASEDFKYGASLAAVGETGAVWGFDNFTAYVMDPKGWLQETLDQTSAKSKMSYKLKKGGDDIYAYLVSVAPAPAEGEADNN